MEDMKKMISEFDNQHIIKQIILIGVSGAIKNIELEVTDENGIIL